MISQKWAQLLCASPHRLEILQYLSEAPADTRDITQVISGSRPSVQRHLNGFADQQWVRKTDGEYHLTPVGGAVTNELSEFIHRLGLINEYSTFLQYLPEFDQPFKIEFLADAHVVTASSTYPHEPAKYYVECLRQHPIEELVGICPIRSPIFDRACSQLLTQRTV